MSDRPHCVRHLWVWTSMGSSVCVCVCVSTGVNKHGQQCVCVYRCEQAWAVVCVCIQVWTSIGSSVCVCIQVWTSIGSSVCVCVCLWVWTSIGSSVCVCLWVWTSMGSGVCVCLLRLSSIHLTCDWSWVNNEWMNSSFHGPSPLHGGCEHILVLEACSSPSWLPPAAAAVPGSAQCQQQTGEMKSVTWDHRLCWKSLVLPPQICAHHRVSMTTASSKGPLTSPQYLSESGSFPRHSP